MSGKVLHGDRCIYLVWVRSSGLVMSKQFISAQLFIMDIPRSYMGPFNFFKDERQLYLAEIIHKFINN